MKNRKIFLAGIAMLCLYSSTVVAQTQIRRNALSKSDSIIMELPDNVKVILITDDINKLQKLNKISLDSIVNTINQQVQQAGHGGGKTKTDTTNTDGPKPDLRYDIGYKRKNDQLALTLGGGAGLIRNQLVPKLAPTIALKRKNMEYSVTYDMNYFFERQENRQFKLYLNSFLEVGIGTKLHNRPKDVDVYQKLNIGYLIHSEGGYFSKNTFKLSYTYPISSKPIRVLPELYITNKFRTIFPGITVTF